MRLPRRPTRPRRQSAGPCPPGKHRAARCRCRTVTAVDDDVVLVQQGNELLDHLINRRTGLDHDLDLARPGEARDEVFERSAADELLARMPGDELVGGRRSAVVDADLEAAALHIQHQVLAHHCQADQAEIALLGGGVDADVAHGISPVERRAPGGWLS